MPNPSESLRFQPGDHPRRELATSKPPCFRVTNRGTYPILPTRNAPIETPVFPSVSIADPYP